MRISARTANYPLANHNEPRKEILGSIADEFPRQGVPQGSHEGSQSLAPDKDSDKSDK